ncbi:MAG TPA: NAD(P)-dependent oxidoreductase [Nitrosopumilaceae archaeon]|jgi:D-3-phosphoglycerate dehydrogenase|nr:NAD(P)-dependent oxidoreductase [Nitrosopumilaceae archaeon]
MKNILFIDSNNSLLHETLLKNGFSCDLFWDKSTEELITLIPNYDAIVIRSKFKITKEIINSAPRLKCIARAGSGMENIDVDYAISKGIKCLHAPEGNCDAVGEHALAMLLSLFNNINKADKEVRKGIWLREANRGEELAGKTVGIIGYGNTGPAFARCLKGFNCKILAFDKYKSHFGNEFVRESNLQEIFDLADIISLHTPLTEETKNMINTEFINKCRKNIYIINTARGKSLVTTDLVENLKKGKILGACLDVIEYETVSFEHIPNENLPPAFQYLITHDNVILTPHIAGWTHQSDIKIAQILADKIMNALNN